MTFDAVLCDLDGVLRLWDPRVMSELDQAYGLVAGTLKATAFAPERLNPAITGQHTDQQWRSAIVADLAPACGSTSTAQELVEQWSAPPGEVNHEVADLLTEIRQHVPVILVTNATTRLDTDLDQLGITALVDGIVNSARTGIAKPDPRVFRLAAERAGVDVTRCLFVDDDDMNVRAADAIGMMCLHYQRPQQLRDVFTSRLASDINALLD